MDLLRYRPMFLWCAAFTAASGGGYLLFGTSLLSLQTARIVALCLILCCVLGGLFAGLFLWLRGRRRQGVTVLVACLLLSFGSGRSLAVFRGEQAVRLSELEHEPVTVRGVVTDRRGSGGYLSSFALEVETVNGMSVDGMAVLTCHYLAELAPGDAVEMTVTVLPFEEAVGDGYGVGALRGDGYVLALLSEDEQEVTVIGDAGSHARVWTGDLRRTLAARLELTVGSDASGLPSALLLGDRSALRDEVTRDFARTGVSHLLAISGLHMTLLFGLLEGLLRLLRVHKRVRAVLLGVASLGYLILLGFPPSATRAVVMLGMVYLSTLLSTRADPVTSLGLAGLLILAVSPHAAADAGFWMSYLATLGLVAVMPWIQKISARKRGTEEADPILRRIRVGACKLGIGLLVGIVAMSFTLSIVAAVIGEMGLLSPVMTLLLTPLCGAILLLSLVALPLFGTAAGAFAGRLIAGICSVMTELTSLAAEPRWVVVSLVHPMILPIAVMLLVGMLILLCLRLPERRRWLLVLPLLIGWTSVAGVLVIEEVTAGDAPEVSYLQPSSQSDMLVLVNGRDAVICDLSNGSLSALNAASVEASRRGATEVAVLMLTHYHRRTVGSLGDFLSRETVRAVWMPIPEKEQDFYYMRALLQKAEDADVEVTFYAPEERLRIFGESELILHTDALERSVQPVLLLSLDTDLRPDRSGELVYCGSAVFESGLSDKAALLVSRADAVIFGQHGPLTKQSFGGALTYRENAQIVITAEEDTAARFDPSGVPPSARLWRGQWRASFP